MKKNILLCVTGGIAVYKAVALTSKLSQSDFNVKIILTKSAMEFVTPLTFQVMSRNDVYYDTFDEKDSKKIAHIDLADWADLIVIAPATANAIGKLANGIADDMVSTTLLAATAPVWIAPAMNVHMYDHPAVKNNIATLYSYGYRFIEPSEGFLACGYVGKGRLEEPEKIVELIRKKFQHDKGSLSGKHVLITAGPTREHVDPVRFFTNHSTGKMGYAIAQTAVELGAKVTLISGPVALKEPEGAEVISIETAEEMKQAVMEHFSSADIVIKSAAVADYRPAMRYDEKMKKSEGPMSLDFERTEDILKLLGQQKKHQILVGFAAETDHVEYNAKKKLQSKNADIIVANNIKQEGAGFSGDTNIVTLYFKNGEKKELPLLSKHQVAEKLFVEIGLMNTPSKRIDTE
ncbi:bifunctional phosphopantothenoylcysteine decarboxylase/phosphopantothenate--cysteine ligase CoaBC [Jeotgalibacillus sp. ET6]|uniref:bifunctional phosphopantothenoylcysteine decarboxylase/phosphopantothenate--cysteine ligase CoaBC n=1 Tax=Jeotgalibacillus sp. ET6 TaxID=3037260 RepID=UPI0024187826|nr:bifunctional phosphopantothenoylcysteine decarboxylase/phosphopantothenate--cysteine ligase CoaBC [Jeotgalibacillus sp. ET6]MDG5470236.1 bifunctional phosphopantothenoylcysteine decarboxylase/phosphopantothenate--cysteine ligase CoaBC [Jeotgalibacillus sp. ET6]